MTAPDLEGSQDVTRATARHDLVTGLVLFGLSAFLFYATFDIPAGYEDEAVGPRFVPQAICILLGLIGAVLAIQGARGRPAPSDRTNFSGARFMVYIAPLSALSFVYVGLFYFLGYWMATILLIAAGGFLFGVRGKALIIMPLIAGTGFYYLFFKLMRVFEPPAKLWTMLDFIPLG